MLGMSENGARRRGHVDSERSPTLPVKNSDCFNEDSPVKSQSSRRVRRGRKSTCSSRIQCLLLVSLGIASYSYFKFYRSVQSPTHQYTQTNPRPPPRSVFRNDTTRSEKPPRLASFKIPQILIFTHYRDLLHATDLEDDEEKVLATNIRRSIHLHGDDIDVRFLTDADCIRSLQNVFPALIPHFVNETQGMFKADICRGSALYESGGMYLDVDVGVRKSLWLDLLPATEFVTSLVHHQSKYPKHFFQAVLGAASKSPIIYKYLELFLDHYTGKDIVKGPLGVILLRRAWDAVYNEDTNSPSTELYQEVLYNKKFFPDLDPAPTWGVRRACHFVVVARAHQKQNAEFNGSDGKRQYHIPLYSRIGGSRMCPIHQSNVTSN